MPDTYNPAPNNDELLARATSLASYWQEKLRIIAALSSPLIITKKKIDELTECLCGVLTDHDQAQVSSQTFNVRNASK